jgi:hypothetical protein
MGSRKVAPRISCRESSLRLQHHRAVKPGTSRAASSFRQTLFSALLWSSRGALRHHERPRGPVRYQGELTCCMTS